MSKHPFWDNDPTPMQVLQRISERHQEVQDHTATKYDFDCLMTDVDNYILAKSQSEGASHG